MTDEVKRHLYVRPYLHASDTAFCVTCAAPADAPQHYTSPVELSELGRKWLDIYRDADHAVQALTTTVLAPVIERRDTALRNLQQILGDSEAATVDGKAVAVWAYRKPAARFETARFRADHPDLAAEYTSTAQPARPFTIIEDIT